MLLPGGPPAVTSLATGERPSPGGKAARDSPPQPTERSRERRAGRKLHLAFPACALLWRFFPSISCGWRSSVYGTCEGEVAPASAGFLRAIQQIAHGGATTGEIDPAATAHPSRRRGR